MSMLRRVLDRESIVKTNLIESLVECVKELQLKYAAKRGGALRNDESTNTLCWILEAVFIHGLKNRFLKSMSSVLTSRENQIPEPSFWEFLLVFCHQEVIIQILQLPLINTDIGRCRAWLRVAINDGLLISYLQLMLGDKSTLRDYYKPSAFLRDSDRCDIMKSYLYGIESYDFQLAFNSSLLNTWNSGPLSLVGLWTPTDTIAQGIDVAENMDDKELQALPQLHNQARTPPKPSFFSLENPSAFRVPLLEEDEALRVILSSRGSGSGSRSASSSRRNSDGTSPLPHVITSTGTVGGTNVTVQVSATINISSSSHVGTSSSPRLEQASHASQHSKPLPITNIKSEPVKNEGITQSHNPESLSRKPVGNIDIAIREKINVVVERDRRETMTKTNDLMGKREENRLQVQSSKGPPKIITPEEELSYAALFDNYNTEVIVGSPGGGSFFDVSPFGSNRFHNLNTTTSSDPALGSSLEENRSVSSTGTPIDSLGFEIVLASDRFSEMLPPIDAYTQRIPREIGLDNQNYQCRSCEHPVGMIYGSVRVCGFTGYYYCSDCHVNDEYVIPSRILLNWDFSRYFISKEAKEFLTELHEQPVLNLQEINSKLYHQVEECAEVQQLRIKLHSISIYLRTCKEQTIGGLMKDFQKDIWPTKEYLYENIHLYSLADLLNIPNRTLATSLHKLVNLGQSHIRTCSSCKDKGFVCEVCRNESVIFPFDLENIFKCSSCGAVYHNKCMDSTKPCPRCERWKITAYDTDLTCM